MLCSVVQQQSLWVWRTLADAAALKCSFNEESLTDCIVLELARGAATGGYMVNAFTKPQEAINGADWELWFTGPSGQWFGYRVQSKKMGIGTTNFPHLHSMSGAVTQVHKLVTAAALVSATPIYALYSTWPAGTALAPTWTCGTYAMSSALWGVSAASAKRIALLAPQTSLGAVAPEMHPFHCLVCCAAYGGTDLPSRAAGFARARIDPDASLLDEAPPHVMRLLGSRRARVDTPAEYDLKLPRDLSRVIVITERVDEEPEPPRPEV